MSLYISSINSGSNGNCYYVGNEQEAILVDAGISCREIEKRMLRNGLIMAHVKAVFISHEHSDHIKGVEVLQKKYKIPVFINEHTYRNSNLKLVPGLTFCFKGKPSLQIGALTVIPFCKHHDAADPYSFCVEYDNVRIGIFTDLGIVCSELVKQFSLCHAAFLESNYDTNMLTNSSYPFFLKRRISGGKGHLSNELALQLFINHRPAFMTHLLLAHLSKNNNHPQLVYDCFKPHAGNVLIEVASRDCEGAVHFIGSQNAQAFETDYSLTKQGELF